MLSQSDAMVPVASNRATLGRLTAGEQGFWVQVRLGHPGDTDPLSRTWF